MREAWAVDDPHSEQSWAKDPLALLSSRGQLLLLNDTLEGGQNVGSHAETWDEQSVVGSLEKEEEGHDYAKE